MERGGKDMKGKRRNTRSTSRPNFIGKWVPVPKKDETAWLSDWLISSMIIKAKTKLGYLPTALRVGKKCIIKKGRNHYLVFNAM